MEKPEHVECVVMVKYTQSFMSTFWNQIILMFKARKCPAGFHLIFPWKQTDHVHLQNEDTHLESVY